MGNNNLVIALIVAVVFLISFPMIFSLIKNNEKVTQIEGPPILQPSQPQQQPPVIIQPAPIIVNPHSHHHYSSYDKGYSDARRRLPPQSNDFEYMRGYREYCRRYPRPGFNFNINIK